MTCTFPMVDGISYLEKLPTKFECLQTSAHQMTNTKDSLKTSWRKCNKEEICKEKLPKENYRIIKND